MRKTLIFLNLICSAIIAAGQTSWSSKTAFLQTAQVNICVSVDCKTTFTSALSSLILNGRVVTTDSPYTCQWDVVQGTGTLTSPTKPTCSVTGLNLSGTYVFRLTAKNSTQTATAYDTVVMLLPNQPPVIAVATLPSPVITATVLLDATASRDPDGTIVKWTWSKVSGPGGQIILNATSPVATVTGLQTGTYTFKIVVTDNLGATTALNVTFTTNIKSIIKVVATYSDGTTSQLFP